MPFDALQTSAIRWNGLSRKGWDRQLLRASFAPLQQSYAFGEVITAHGGETLRAELMAGDETIGLCQIAARKLFGFRLATALYGPVWLQEGLSSDTRVGALDQLGRSLPIKGLHAFLIMPPDAGDDVEKQLRLNRVVSPYHTVLIDLNQEEKTIRSGMDGKWRNRLKAGEKAGLTITPLGRRSEQYGWLLEVERKQQKRQGYRGLSPFMVPAFQEEAGKESVVGFEAKLGTERVAAMLILLHGSTATYYIGWSSEEGRKANAMNVLMWRSICQLKKKGVRTFDLGGADTEQTAGITRFKLGTGGRLLTQSGTWLLRPRLR